VSIRKWHDTTVDPEIHAPRATTLDYIVAAAAG